MNKEQKHQLENNRRAGDKKIKTINRDYNECYFCNKSIPTNTFGGGHRCSHCNKWQPEITVHEL